MLPAPAPWPYIADFTRPEGLQRRPHWALFFPFELLTQLAVQNQTSILPYTTALPKGSRYLTTSAYLSMNTPRSSLCMVLYALTTELSALRRYVGRIRFFIHSRSQPNNKFSSACRFHTAHRQAPCSGLTLPRRRNAVAYIWQGRLGIEPTQAVLETASPALEHSPLCLSVFPDCHRCVSAACGWPP